MINVALIGYGHLGRWHLDKALSFENVNVVAVVDPDPTTPHKLKERGLNVKVVTSLSDVMSEIDAGLVVTPTSYHFDLVMELLSHDKHVFCEKPMTSTFDESLKIENALKGKQLIFQVGHSERFHSIWEEVRNNNNYFSGESLIRFERQAAFKGRATDVDVVQDLMIHDIDLMLSLIHERPYKVQTIGHRVRTDHYDFVQAEFYFKSGKKVQIISGRNYTHEVRSFEVLGEAGTMRVDLFKCEFTLAPANTSDDHVVMSSYEKRDHLHLEQTEFYKAIETGSAISAGITEGLSAIYLVSKVIESLDDNKELTLEYPL